MWAIMKGNTYPHGGYLAVIVTVTNTISDSVELLTEVEYRIWHLCTSRTHLNFAIITVFLPTFDT